VPEVASRHARRADEELADVQFELLTEDVVGEAYMPRVIDQVGQDRIQFDDVFTAKGLIRVEFGICGSDTIQAPRVPGDLLGIQRVLEKDDAITLEDVLLPGCKPGWGDPVWNLRQSCRLHGCSFLT